ncbi:MAG: hypothetical protein GC159_03815 [Phycisphaera sp.]|nr:hypothetical protein [Phycisphaera sp.]
MFARSAPDRRTLIPAIIAIPLAALILTLAACLPVPLGDPEQSKANDKLSGVWLERKDDGTVDESNIYVMIPYDARTHMLRVLKVDESSPDELKTKEEGQYKVWVTAVKGRSFLTLHPLVPAAVLSEDDAKKRFFLHAKFDLSDDRNTLLVWGLKGDDFEPFKGVKTSDDVRRAVEANVDNTEMYGDKTTYTRVTDQDRLQKLRKLYSWAIE